MILIVAATITLGAVAAADMVSHDLMENSQQTFHQMLILRK